MNAFDNLLKAYSFIRPVLDVALMAFIIYKSYEFIVKTNALQIIKAASVVAMAYAVATFFHLDMILWVLQKLAPGLVICFAIVFQPELRKVFLKIGQSQWFAFGNRSKHTYVDAVILAADMLSKMKRGMLVVFPRHTKIDDVIETGTIINADISSALLVTIFGHDTPLHDAACIIQGGKIIAAGCFLPLSEQYDIKKTFGTRHRAALGLAESTDAVILVVSEESGAISLAYDSQLHYDLTARQIKVQLEKLLDVTPEQKTIEDTIDENIRKL